MEDLESSEEQEECAEGVLYSLPQAVQGEILFELGYRIDATSVRVSSMRGHAGLNNRIDESIKREEALLEGWQKVWSLVDAVMDSNMMLVECTFLGALAWFVNMTANDVEVCSATKYMLQKTHHVCLTAKPFDDGEVEIPAQNDFENCARALTDLNAWGRLDEMLEHGWTKEHLDQICKERVA